MNTADGPTRAARGQERGVLMATNTKKKTLSGKARSLKKDDYYERTIVQPATRLIAAIKASTRKAASR